MAVGESPKVGVTTAARRAAPLRGAAGAVTAASPSGAPRAAADTVSVMGIPEAELTPRVRAAITSLMAEVDMLRREIYRSRERLGDLERLADQAPLTPIANRRAFVRELSRFIATAERYGTPSSVIYFDLNGLKAINDTHGHSDGDEALVRVATILRENVRESDVVGRLGGDEFGVILYQTALPAGLEKARVLAARIHAQPLQFAGRSIVIEVAYGVYAIGPGVSVGDALAAADRAMYAHKLAEKEPAE